MLNQTLSQLRQVQRHREATRPRPAYNDYHLDVGPDLLPLSLARERGLGGEGFLCQRGLPAQHTPSCLLSSRLVPAGARRYPQSDVTP